MKNGIVIFLLFLCLQNTAQIAVYGGYNYLRAPQWDEAMFTYNFARPWQEDQINPLTHGWEVRASWIFRWKVIKSLYVQPQIGIRQFTSSATNSKEELFVRARQYTAQFDVNFNPRALFQNVSAGPLGTRFMMYFSPALHLWQPYSEQGGRAFYTDDDGEEYSPITWSWSLGLGAGYRAMTLYKNLIVTPKFGFRFAPVAELIDFANAVQGANTTGLEDEAKNLFIFEAGIELAWIFPRTKSGKGYNRPCSNC